MTGSTVTKMTMTRRVLAALSLAAVVPLVVAGQQRPEQAPDDRALVFRGGIELINVTATVTDARGRFVSGLTKDDFRVYQDGELVDVTHFNNERVPVSLGIVLDTSESMDGQKMAAAQRALGGRSQERFQGTRVPVRTGACNSASRCLASPAK